MQNKVFKNVKVMCYCAMLTALSVGIAWVCKMFLTITPYFRITFENLPLIFAGYFFGPVAGLLCGIASDILSTALSQYGIGGINPIITLGAGCVGLFAGLVPFIAKRKSRAILILSVYTAHTIGNILIKSAGLNIMYSWSLPLLLPRIPLYIVIAAIELGVMIILTKNKEIENILREKI